MLSQPGLYVHLPWCVKKCPYCDFNSHPLKAEHDLDQYVEALGEDFASQSLDQAFATVFFGGGTPSLFQAHHFTDILSRASLSKDAEITMEANPGTTEHANFDGYLNAGINRLSIGAQSFHNPLLKALGRIHNASETHRAFRDARASGFENINIDLMWGLPNQTVDQCLEDLRTAIELDPEHISWYQLTLEPKTEFARRPPILPVEDHLAAMETQGLALLDSHGYGRYEVSAFSKTGRQCKHNLNYWRFGDYAGVGAGAHGKQSLAEEVVRTQKPHQPRLFQADPAKTILQRVTEADLFFEFMLNALRLTDGVTTQTFKSATRLPIDVLQPIWSSLVEQSLMREDRIATTPLGYRYLDTVVSSFLPASSDTQ
jgi:putative oxygen-independent coproporphyrinogen III oxidase